MNKIGMKFTSEAVERWAQQQVHERQGHALLRNATGSQENTIMQDPFTLVVDGKLVGFFPTDVAATLKAKQMLMSGADNATVHDEVNFTQKEVELSAALRAGLQAVTTGAH